MYDHLIRVTDELDTDRELVAGTLEVYLSTVNNNLSIDHEAADRRHGDPRRDRRRRRDLRHERGGAAFRTGEGSGFWVITGFVVIGAAMTAIVLRRIDWI